jgi:histidinol-phosphatase (PHP family)
MYLSNYHSHNTFCDGRSHPEDFVRHAISKGMKALGFSSHAPLPFDTFWTMNRDDVVEYFQEIERLKQKYCGQIEIYAGLETDYLDHTHNAKTSYFVDLPTDYLICSIHYIVHPVSGELMPIDGDYADFESGTTRLFDNKLDDVIRAFFDQSIDMVRLGGFDIIGHVDKIYLNAGKHPDFSSFQYLVDELMGKLLKMIVLSGLILEINTKSLLSSGITYPQKHYFQQISNLRIPITINCDSHYPDHVMQGKSEIVNRLRACGFTHTKELIEGKWQTYPL